MAEEKEEKKKARGIDRTFKVFGERFLIRLQAVRIYNRFRIEIEIGPVRNYEKRGKGKQLQIEFDKNKPIEGGPAI